MNIGHQGTKDTKIGPSPVVDTYARRVIGCAIEVHRQLGPGYLEAVYERALAIEFGQHGIPFVRQHPIAVAYKGRTVGEGRLDFLVASSLIVELKAIDALAPVHVAQVISYLKTTGLDLGLLLNFGAARMIDGIKRVVL